MADFEKAIAHVKRWEGGWVDDPADPGGATNHGVSLRMALADADVDIDVDGDGDEDGDDIRALSWEQAKAIYKQKYWLYEGVTNDLVACKLLDMGVNAGSGRAHRICQRALNACGGWNLKVDGVWGAATERAVNETDPKLLLTMLNEMHRKFYQDLIAERPTLRKFEKGWLRRAESIQWA